MSSRVAPRRVRVAWVAVAAALLLGACGDTRADTTPGTAAAPATAAASTTAATSTTTTTTTSTTSTTTSTTTTVPATTTTATVATLPAEQLTLPIPPPADQYADEPAIELGTLEIPAIGVSMTMYEGIRLVTLDRGPGHWPGSAMPGQPGNVVVAGHRTSRHRVFRDLDRLVAGDEIVFTDGAGRHVYRVTRTEIVDPSAVWIVDPTPTPTVTLFACHPPGSISQRIAVFADLVP